MTKNTLTSNNVPHSDNTLSNEQWQIIERDLITEKIPVFHDEEEMMQFYQKTALLFCPEGYGFPENSKMRLVLYKRKLDKITHWVGRILRFPFKEDVTLIQTGVGYALMDSNLSLKNKKRLNAEWCKALCYLSDVNRSLTIIYPLLAIILQQKRDLRLLIGTYIPTAEEEALLKEQEQQTETGQEHEA